MAHYDNLLILDVASAPLPDAERYLEGTVRAPSNYKDEEKIAAYIAEKQAERLQAAALDIDLARVIGVGCMSLQNDAPVVLVGDDDERFMLTAVADWIHSGTTIVTFNGFAFDLPLLMRRARYLGVAFPKINLDRYRSPHRDLCEELSDRTPQRRKSLEFYARRLDMGITKTLSGAEEAQVPVSGRWNDLRDSLVHDVTATKRLAEWMGIWPTDLAEASGF